MNLSKVWAAVGSGWAAFGYIFIIGQYVWKFYPLIQAYRTLPKLVTWQDPHLFYAYLREFIYSDFLALVVKSTPFYVDEAALDRLKIAILDRVGYDAIYKVLTGQLADTSLDGGLRELFNFINTVKMVRSVL